MSNYLVGLLRSDEYKGHVAGIIDQHRTDYVHDHGKAEGFDPEILGLLNQDFLSADQLQILLQLYASHGGNEGYGRPVDAEYTSPTQTADQPKAPSAENGSYPDAVDESENTVDNPFIPLGRPKKDEATSFNNRTGFYCLLELDNDTILPREAVKDWNSILEVIVEKKDTRGIYQEAKLDFYPAGTRGFPAHIKGLTYKAIRDVPVPEKATNKPSKGLSEKATNKKSVNDEPVPEQAAKKPAKPASGNPDDDKEEKTPSWQGVIEISLDTLGGIGLVLDYLHGLTAPTIAKSQYPNTYRKFVIRLRITPQREDWTLLEEQAANIKDPWATVLEKKEKDNSFFFNLSIHPFDIHTFTDPTYFNPKFLNILVSFGTSNRTPKSPRVIQDDLFTRGNLRIDNLVNTDELAQLCEFHHFIGFIHFDKRLVMGMVRIANREDRSGRSIRFDPNTAFEITVKDSLGICTEHIYEVDDCDFLLHIYKSRKVFLDAEFPSCKSSQDEVNISFSKRHLKASTHNIAFKITVKVLEEEEPIETIVIVTDIIYEIEDCDLLLHIYKSRKVFLNAKKETSR
ncbi:MAG: hypothetical protein M1812_003738 [Candelaria pacifica]|nr:MAG: hypothetical protein M1812_003738 [Candelaria pacifica]